MTTTIFTGNETNARHSIMQAQSDILPLVKLFEPLDLSKYAWPLTFGWYRLPASGRVVVILKD